ncbi:mammalian cell entry protein [Mycobacterium sp. Root135]|uniref:mammalian cell entry protein n=1 Tax=Mycobacterium sp. Root135 TaxID=1736457 RepID=UPI001F1FC0A9|nr:mammalian cell entry protein [Mycobacterium sp. Root135]
MLLGIGGGVVLLIVLALVVSYLNPFGGRAKGLYSVGITTTYVGQGVVKGTAVVLHGVKVGEVTNVMTTAGGEVRLETDLETEPTKGLTNEMGIDYRPVNYFGVPGVNLIPKEGGQVLRDGSQLSLVPTGNFTLAQLLYQLGDVSQASLTPQLISVVDRITRYTDGLNPLFESLITISRAVEAVQTEPTQEQVGRLGTALTAVPPFANELIIALRRVQDFSFYPGKTREPAESSAVKLAPPYLTDVVTPSLGDMTDEYFDAYFDPSLNAIQNGVFKSIGKLVASHVDDLYPLISGLKALTDTVPALLRPRDVAQKLAELRDRFEKLYAGNGDQHAISVRLLLDSLPGVAAPMGIVPERTP